MHKNLQVDQSPNKNHDNTFNEYFSRYNTPIKKYVYTYLKDSQLSEEITQNVFLKFYRNFERLEPDNLCSWLYRVARNEVIDNLKKKTTDTFSLEEQYIEPFTLNTPQKEIETKSKRETIKKILLKLPKNQRTAIVLKDVRGYSYKEIAKLMDTTHKAVKSLIYRGRQNFIKYYKEVAGDEL